MITVLCFTLLAVANAADRPLVNLADGNPKVLRALFSSFQRENDRHYANVAEARMRLKNFREFVHLMAQANDVDDGVEYGVTFFADLTEDEAQQYYGVPNQTAPVHPPEPAEGELEEPSEELKKRLGSSSLSWKSKYNNAKHQSTCGSCWAFTTVGVVEGMAAIKTGRKHNFSEQEVLDCSSNSNTCKGGWHYEALGYIKQRNHLASGSQYRYQNRRGSCRYKSYSNAMPFRINGVHQARGDANLVKYLANGPIGINLDWTSINIRGYYNGIWTRGPCRGHPTHAITLTGYTSSYWEIRNSWGTGWGDRGYFKLTRQQSNMCRIGDYAYFMTTAASEIEE